MTAQTTYAQIRGGSTFSGHATAAWDASAGVVAGSTLQVPVFLMGGHAIGSGTLSGHPIQERHAAGTAHGVGTLTAGVRQIIILGAQPTGVGTLEFNPYVQAAGTAAGSGSLSGTPVQIVHPRTYPMVGRGASMTTCPCR